MTGDLQRDPDRSHTKMGERAKRPAGPGPNVGEAGPIRGKVIWRATALMGSMGRSDVLLQLLAT